MRREHAKFIDSAADDQLRRVREEIENLLKVLREPDVRQEARILMREIDRELLDRVLRRHRLSQGQEEGLAGLPALRAA